MAEQRHGRYYAQELMMDQEANIRELIQDALDSGEHNEWHLVGASGLLGALTPDHPEVCGMAETLIAGLAGVPVREPCDRRVKPRCCFEVALSESTAAQA